MNVIFHVLCRDSSSPFGRFDKATMPQQSLMEMLIEGIVSKDEIRGSVDNPKDITDWKDIILNEDKEVIEIFWSGDSHEGTLSLEYLPPTLKYFGAAQNFLCGTIDLTCLPEALEILDLHENKLEGSVSLERLPESLTELNLSNNCFTGSICLTKLPKNMTMLLLGYNGFEGLTDFSRLPSSLVYLEVSHTKLSGAILFTKENEDFFVEHSDVKIFM